MTEPTNAALVAANSPGLSEDQRRLIELDDAIAKIRTQIATADMARQRGQKPVDPDWFHRASTALRHLSRERAELLAKGTGRRRREKLKDALISILRERHDPSTWDKREADARILFAGIQSIHRRALEIGHTDLVLIDEAHLIPGASNTMYRRFLDELQAINPRLKVIGLTATPFRLDCGMLHEGDNALFTDIAFEVSVRDLIDQGYLCPLISKRPKTRLDVSNVGTRAGDFIARDLAAAVDQPSITTAAIDEVMDYGRERRSWLLFCAGVDHARHVAAAIEARGIPCGTIFGRMPA